VLSIHRPATRIIGTKTAFASGDLFGAPEFFLADRAPGEGFGAESVDGAAGNVIVGAAGVL
jgi:hypothetical protein